LGNIIEYVAISKWDDALYTPIYWVYFTDASVLAVELAIAAYVMYSATDATIHMDIGHYFQYADWSDVSKLTGALDFL
jgi:hypothetical protein